MPKDTATLVDEASRGSAPAIEELMERHLPALRAFIRLRASPALRAREGVSDVAQSVCRQILQHIDRFQFGGEAGFKHWLYTEALRRIQNKHEFHRAGKRDVRREVALGRDDSAAPAGAQLQQVYCTLSTPSGAAMAREQLDRVEAAFDQLTDVQREIVTLSRIVGLSHQEIAARTGRTEGAVRVALHRALARLSSLLDEPGHPTGP